MVIYANATVLGRITVGEGATIGSNVWVTSDVEPGGKACRQNIDFCRFFIFSIINKWNRADGSISYFNVMDAVIHLQETDSTNDVMHRLFSGADASKCRRDPGVC